MAVYVHWSMHGHFSSYIEIRQTNFFLKTSMKRGFIMVVTAMNAEFVTRNEGKL